MDDVLFLALDDVVAIHAEQLARYGGTAGMLSQHALASAMAAPQTLWAYEPEADLFLLAAAYAYHLAQAHAFVDGNKRMAYLTTLTFLAVNDVVVTEVNQRQVRVIVEDIAVGRCDRDSAAARLRQAFGPSSAG